MAAQENVITKTTDFIEWFLPKIEKFPRNYKFLFGDRIVQIELDLLENLIEAYYRRDKLDYLRSANVNLEKLRQLLRIATEMKFISIRQLEFATGELGHIGSLVGGWIRQQESKKQKAVQERRQ